MTAPRHQKTIQYPASVKRLFSLVGITLIFSRSQTRHEGVLGEKLYGSRTGLALNLSRRRVGFYWETLV